jgi:hypothetical protein
VFDTISGLPVHPLAVHAVVVLLPLAAVITAVVAVRPGWRRFAGPVVVADALVAIFSLVAKESGESLQHRLTSLGTGAVVAADHGEKGALLPIFAVLLFVASVVVWYARRRPALVVPAIALAVLTGLAAIGWTVVVGDTGARAVWGQVVSSTSSSK